MDHSSPDDHFYFFGLTKKDFYFTLLITALFIICFYFIFNYDFGRVTESIKAIVGNIFLIFQIATLSALTLAFFYAYQLTKNTSFFYIALCWFAHVMYKIFTIGFDEPKFENGHIKDLIQPNGTVNGEVIGYQFLLIAIIALVADVPLFLSVFTQKERRWWFAALPIGTLIMMVFVYYTDIDLISKIKFVYFVSPFQSLLILLWLSYAIIVKNTLGISRRLSILLASTFVALSISQIPFIYKGYCFPCEQDEMVKMGLRLFALITFISILTVVFFIVKKELSKLYEKKKSAEEQLKVKGEFEDLGYLAASIEHELRNPLEVIKGEIDKLNKRFQNDEDLKDKFHPLETQIYRMALAANIIKILRLKKDEFAKNLKETLVVDRIKSSIKYVKKELPLWSEKMSIKEDEHNKELFILAFPPYLEQTFVNLLKNSYEAIDRTGKRGEVSIDLYLVDKNTVGIAFRDTGEGFISEDIPNLIKPDYTKKDKSKSESNRGLGLFVCDKVVNLHNGTLRFSNTEYGGAEVKLEFPRHLTKKMMRAETEKIKFTL